MFQRCWRAVTPLTVKRRPAPPFRRSEDHKVTDHSDHRNAELPALPREGVRANQRARIAYASPRTGYLALLDREAFDLTMGILWTSKDAEDALSHHPKEVERLMRQFRQAGYTTRRSLVQPRNSKTIAFPLSARRQHARHDRSHLFQVGTCRGPTGHQPLCPRPKNLRHSQSRRMSSACRASLPSTRRGC